MTHEVTKEYRNAQNTEIARLMVLNKKLVEALRWVDMWLEAALNCEKWPENYNQRAAEARKVAAAVIAEAEKAKGGRIIRVRVTEE